MPHGPPYHALPKITAASLVDNTVDDIIDRMYAEILRSASWPDALALLPKISDHGGWFLSTHDHVNGIPLYRLSTRGLMHTEGEYNQYLYDINERLQRALQADTGKVLRGSDTMSDREFRNSAYYAEFLRNHDLFHVFGGILHRQAGLSVTAGCLRSEDEGDFSTEEVAFLKRLCRSLNRLLAVQARVSSLIDERDAALGAASRAQVGMVLLDRAGLIMHSNAVAEAIVDAAPAIRLERGRLSCSRPADQRLLQSALAQPIGEGPRLPVRFQIADAGDREGIECMVLPIETQTESVLGEAAEQACHAILLRQPQARAFVNPELIATPLRLTPAEAAVAAALANGLDSEACCQLLDISRNTFKTHLKQAFAKTGCHTQAQLVRRVLVRTQQMRESLIAP